MTKFVVDDIFDKVQEHLVEFNLEKDVAEHVGNPGASKEQDHGEIGGLLKQLLARLQAE